MFNGGRVSVWEEEKVLGMLLGMVGPRCLMPLSCALTSVETTDFVLHVFHHSKDLGQTTPRPRLRAWTSTPGNLPTPPAVLPVSVNPCLVELVACLPAHVPTPPFLFGPVVRAATWRVPFG